MIAGAPAPSGFAPASVSSIVPQDRFARGTEGR